jgi:hypothetical protein
VQRIHKTPRKENQAGSSAKYSKPELVNMIALEKEKYESERQRRMLAEEELRKMRQRYEDREDMCLKIMVTN